MAPRPALTRAAFWTLACLALLGLWGCGSDYTSYGEARLRRAHANLTGPVLIAVVQSSNDPNTTWQGAQLAADEFNAEGGVLGHKLELMLLDDQGDPRVGEHIARDLAANPDVVAVVGHNYSRVAIPNSIIYGVSGLTFISTGASDPRLTLLNNPYCLRTVPNDETTVRALAQYAQSHGLHRLMVLFEQGLTALAYGQDFSNLFLASAINHQLEVLQMRSFFLWQQDVRPTLLQMRRDRFDAIMLVAFMPQSAQIIKQVRRMGITQPILGGDSLYEDTMPPAAEGAAEGVVCASFYDPRRQTPANLHFVKAFRERFGQEPEVAGAHAHDAIHLLAQGIRECGSVVPIEMANAIRYLEGFQGATGTFTFNPQGDPVGKEVTLYMVKNGLFEPVGESSGAKYTATPGANQHPLKPDDGQALMQERQAPAAR